MKMSTLALLFAITVLLFPFKSIAQWTVIESGVTKNLNDIQFIDEKSGWAVGDSGTIIHTSDGGLTWEQQESQTTWDISRVFFANNQVGYALSIREESSELNALSAVLITKNGGQNWEQFLFGDFYELFGIHFINPDTGFVSGDIYQPFEFSEGIIFKTTDGGKSWEQNFSYMLYDSLGVNPFHDHENRLYFEDIVFVNDSVGYAEQSGTGIDWVESDIYRTNDSGNSWHFVSMAPSTASRLSIVGQDTIWCNGFWSSASFDAGNTWNEFSGWPITVDLIYPINGKTALYSYFDAISKVVFDENNEPTSEVIFDHGGVKYNNAAQNGNDLWFTGNNGSFLKYTFGSVVSIAAEPINILPTDYTLSPNYPNPFNPETTIEFILKSQTAVSLSIFNIEGKIIKNMINKKYSPGRHKFMWNGTDNLGNPVASGIYFYRLSIDNKSITRKMMLIK